MPYKREFVWCQWCFRNITKHGYKRHLASKICTARRTAAELRDQGWVRMGSWPKSCDDVPTSVVINTLHLSAAKRGLLAEFPTWVVTPRGPVAKEEWIQAWVYEAGAVVWDDMNRKLVDEIKELIELGPDSGPLRARLALRNLDRKITNLNADI